MDISIRSSEGPDFDCYLAAPATAAAIPAIVLASAIHGVDSDLRAIADELASHGYIAAAPDLFWRTLPGPLVRPDERAASRAQPRRERIKAGEQDLRDVLRALHQHPFFNGRAAVIGFCYGGPYAILGPKRLGYEAGIAFHGSQMLDYVAELDGAGHPMCFIWGDQDHLAPAAVRDAYHAASTSVTNVAVHVLPAVKHGYMMRGNAAAFDLEAYDFSMACALSLLQSLRSDFPGSRSEPRRTQRVAGRPPRFVAPTMIRKEGSFAR